MAEFHTTTGISHVLEEMIKGAQEKLVLISPYLRVNPRFRSLLEDKARMKIDIRLIYGKSELQPEEINWLNGLQGLRTTFLKNLHAKCYLNENEAMVTSMNLYDFSETNNDEMGIRVTKSADPDLYKKIYDEAQRLLRSGQEIKLTMERVTTTEMRPAKEEGPRKAAAGGYCIRCNVAIDLNPKRPYCGDCFSKWNVYKNEEYPEKYCHICGKDNKSTLLRPACIRCYKANKDLFPTAVRG